MSLLDRVRDLVTHPPEGETWDDHGVEDVVALTSTLAAASDAEPDDPRLAGTRASVLGAFAAAQLGTERGQGAPGRTPPPAGVAPVIRRGGRRPALILATAVVLFVTSLGTVAASAPGGPLYDVRIGAEGLLLPAAPDDRALAEVERLDARVAEATGAAGNGDAAGVDAALSAYARIATEAATVPGVELALLARLKERVRAQLEVISGIGPGDLALEADRERARVAAMALIVWFGDPGEDDGPVVGPGPSGSPGPRSGGTAAPGSPGPAATPTSTGGPAPSAGARGSSVPGAQAGSPSPGATSGPRQSSSPAGRASPKPSRAPERTPTPTRRSSTAAPSPAPGGGAGPGSQSGGGGVAPAPTSGSGSGGGSSGASP